MNDVHPSSLIDLIYDSIADSEALCALPEAIASATGSDSSWVMGDLSFGRDVATKPSISCVHGLDDKIIRHYEAGEYLRDPWLEAGPKVDLGKAFSMARLVDKAAFCASPIYNEFIRGSFDVMHCMALAIPVDGQIIAYAMQRGARGRAYDESDEARLDVLRPHLIRLLRARQLRRKNGVSGRTNFDALLIGLDPVFLCDISAHVAHLNVPAVDLLAQRTLLQISADGSLSFNKGELNLGHAVRDALRRGIPTLHSVTVAGKRWIIRIDAAQDGSKIAIVQARDIEAFVQRKVDSATRRFGFTKAEAMLAASLAKGVAIEEHARKRSIKITTVRSQISSLLAKTECERQAQFISVLHEMPLARG